MLFLSVRFKAGAVYIRRQRWGGLRDVASFQPRVFGMGREGRALRRANAAWRGPRNALSREHFTFVAVLLSMLTTCTRPIGRIGRRVRVLWLLVQ